MTPGTAGPSGATLRRAGVADLEAVNAVVESAVMSWALPERVKRLSLPVYRYAPADLQHLTLVVATTAGGEILGVAAWEPVTAAGLPAAGPALLLHGLYVRADHHGRGLGSRLLDAARDAARAAGCAGLLVKASREAQGFFRAAGLEPLPVADAGRDYPFRFWASARD